MADLMTMFGYGEKAAEAGVKMFVGPNENTEYVVIRRANNKGYAAELTKVMQDNAKRLEYLEKSDPDAHTKLSHELFIEVVAKTVIVELGPGITFKGKKVADTWQARSEILLAPTDFYLQCMAFANDNKNYPVEFDVEEAKKP